MKSEYQIRELTLVGHNEYTELVKVYPVSFDLPCNIKQLFLLSIDDDTTRSYFASMLI